MHQFICIFANLMKIIVSITMSLLFLFQGVAVHMEVCEQIEEISHFLKHYQEHKEVDGSSFFEYVYEDYINKSGQSESHHHDSEHDNSPAHSNHQCCQHFVFYSPFQPSLISTISNEEHKQISYYSFQLNSRYPESLFQPPKV